MGDGAVREVVGACSLDCPDGCSWVVSLDASGTPVKLRGNPDHPFTRGGLCSKVNPYLEYATRPDRLMHPLRRVGAKGEGRFERISWDDALNEIAERFGSIIDEWGGEAIWPFVGTGSVGWIQGAAGSGRRLFHHLGASKHVVNICSLAGHVGMGFTTGSTAGMDPEDLAHSKLILLWGTNTLTSNQHLWPIVRDAQRKGAEVVVIDPARTRTARRADRHIALLPGTDAALALGVMAHLVDTGKADLDYLKDHSVGFDSFVEAELSHWSPARAAAICDIDEAEVIWLADRLAEQRPTGIRTSMGAQRHAGGGQALRVLSCLPAITGDFGRLGGGICYSTSPAYTFDLDALWRPDLAPDRTRTLFMTRLGEGLLDLDDPPVKALFVWGANPMVSNPDTGRVRQGLERDDLFTVVVDHLHTDTTAFADLVLPGTTQLEHSDLHDSFSHLYVQWNEPAVEPPGECLSHTELFRRIAKTMGLTEPALFASDHELARAALGEHEHLDGITLERLREEGWARLSVGERFQPFLESFPTTSGRFEFANQLADQFGYGLHPNYRPPAEAAELDAEPASFALLAPADHDRLNSVFNNPADNSEPTGEDVPVVAVHPTDALTIGLVDGCRARVANDRGEFEAVIRVDDSTRPGVALTTKGRRLDAGNGVNSTVPEIDADMGRGAVYHDNRVVIEPLG